MITEDYVSFEVAKLLKEKGFECEKKSITAMYNELGEFHSLSTAADEYYDYGDFDNYDYVAPTLQMAMKWLREVHNIHIIVQPYTDIEGHHFNFLFDTYAYGGWQELAIYIKDSWNTYEAAVEAAIKYCLENLI